MAVRAKLLLLAGSEGGDPAAGAAAKELVESALADRPVERTLLPSALRVACGQPDAARLYDRLIDRAKRPKSPEEGYQLIRAVGYFEAPELIDRTLRFAISPEARTQDVPYLLGEILQARATRRPGWRFVQAHWPEVEAKLTNYVTPEVVDALSSFCDAGARAEVADFFARHPVPAAARTLRQTLETIDQCIDVRARQQAALSAWLTAHAAKR
jgi:aminopeptidase N